MKKNILLSLVLLLLFLAGCANPVMGPAVLLDETDETGVSSGMETEGISSNIQGPLPVWVLDDEFDSNGRFTLPSDYYGRLVIAKSNVNLYMGRHTISGDGTGAGIVVDGQTNVTIRYGTVENFEIGVHLTNMTGMYNVTEIITKNNSRAGFKFENLNSLGSTYWPSVYHCSALENNSRGFYLKNVKKLSFYENTSRDNSAEGVRVENSSNVKFTYMNSQGNGRDGFDFGDCSSITIDRCPTRNNAANGIEFDRSSYCTIKNSSVTDNGNNGVSLSDFCGFFTIDTVEALRNGGDQDDRGDDGIGIDDSSYVTVKNCNASYNVRDGIHVRSSSNITLLNNVTVGNGDDGVDD